MSLFHRHKWEAIAADPYVRSWKRKGVDLGTDDITLVLSKCAVCGSTTTEQIVGHWTLDQIKGKQQ